jgi:hypothetical protein
MVNSVVRRPLLLRRPRSVVELAAAQPIRERLELGLEELNFLMLPKHDVAQFGDRAFEEGDLRLDLFQRRVGVHRSPNEPDLNPCHMRVIARVCSGVSATTSKHARAVPSIAWLD